MSAILPINLDDLLHGSAILAAEVIQTGRAEAVGRRTCTHGFRMPSRKHTQSFQGGNNASLY